MPTISQLLSDIDARLPNTKADGTKVGWMNDCQSEIWRYLASTEMYEFDTIAGQALYTLSTDIQTDKIKSIQVSGSTTIDGTESYTNYEYAGPNDSLTGNHWYDALNGRIGIYPVPSTATGDGYRGKVIYEATPAPLSTNNLGATPSIDVEHHDILKWRCLRDIASAGHSPDIDLVNNYTAMYNALYSRIRMAYYKRKAANPKSRFDYRDGWWNG